MAARNTTKLGDEWKERIRASMLLNRLEANALGELEKPMDANQVRSAEILLKKIAPDLKAVEQTGQIDHEHTLSWEK